MNPINKTLPPSSVGPSAPIGLDWMKRPFNVTVTIYTSGAASYDVQAALDDIMTTPPANVRWMTAADVPAGQIGSYTGKITTPCTAIRLNVASNAAALELRVVQG
jgi:hypothetical protein